MKPTRTRIYPRRLRAALAGVGIGVLAAFASITANAQYICTQTVASGNNWNGAYWYLPPDLTDLVTPPSPATGFTFTLVANAAAYGNGLNNTRMRNPTTTGVVTFPGDSLTLNTNTELRAKNNGSILNFPGPAAGGPGLILNGGIIDIGDDGNFPFTGIIQVNPGQSYICGGSAGGAAPANARSVDIQGKLTGSGNLLIWGANTIAPQKVSGAANTFTGNWIVKAGYLMGSAAGSLGTGNITIDPNYAMPEPPFDTGTVAINGPAILSVGYGINSPGTLTIANGGQFNLNQNCCFAAVTINGTALAAGTYWYSNLISQFSANFPAGAYGTITVQPFGTPPTLPPATPPLQFTKIKWIDADVGGPTFAGSATDNGNGTITIQGGGSDIWNNSSQFNYYYAWAYGTSWDTIVQFQSFSGPANWSKVELLVDDANPAIGPQGGDPFIAMMDTQPSSVAAPDGSGNGVNDGGIDQFRTAMNGASDWKQVGATPAPNYPNNWFRINRNGSIFTLYSSPDGMAWTTYVAIDTSKNNLIGQDASTSFGTAWPNLVCVGVAVTAHNNTWTDPTTGLPAGATAVIASLEGTFGPATTPTLIATSQQVASSLTNVLGTENTLYYSATNNAFPNPLSAGATIYQWTKNGKSIQNATTTSYTWLLDATDAGAQYQCLASVPAPYTALTTNSIVCQVGLTPGIYYTNGLRMEFFSFAATAPAPGVNDPRLWVEQGNAGPATWLSVRPNFDDPGGYGNDYASRVSGWFVPPAQDSYVFFLAGDDDSDLFLSTDATVGNAVMIAQEAGWSGTDNWLGIGGASILSQKRSDQFQDPVTGAMPGAGGILLQANTPYFIEAVHYQGGGGDNLGVTYSTESVVTSGAFANYTPSVLTAASNNIVFCTKAVTKLTWVTQPTNAIASVGFSGKFYAQATSDSEFPVLYTWYEGTPATNVATTMATSYSTPATISSDQGAMFYVVAHTAENELSITSAAVMLNVGLPVAEKGWAKNEYWYTANPGVANFVNAVTDPVSGLITNYLKTTYTVAPDNTIFEPRLEGESLSNEAGDNYTERCSAYFYPPATDDYVFFVNSDDDSALFVSPDGNPAHAFMVAQEASWSNPWQWTVDNGGGSAGQKRSDQWADPNGNIPFQNGIRLVANPNQPCYVAIIHHEGGGGDNCEATFKRLHTGPGGNGVADADPALGSYSAFRGNLIASYAPRCFNMSFTQPPGTVTVPFGGIATLTVTATTDSKNAVGDENDPRNEWNNFFFYQWVKKAGNQWIPIQGANSSSYSFGPVSPLDSQEQIACAIRALGYVDNNYTPLWATSSVANIVVTGSPVYEPGFVLHEFYALNPPVATIVAGNAGTPTWLMASPAFEVDTLGTDALHGGTYDNFSDELVGFFEPSVSGNYVFFLNSDDDGQLFISADASASGKYMIAQETGWGSGVLQWGNSAGNAAQVRSDTFVDPTTGITLYSNGIPLQAYTKYFMLAAHHQGGGGTYTCVYALLLPNAAPASGTVTDMRGAEVGCYVPKCSYVNVTTQPQSIRVPSYTTATFTAAAATDSTVPVGTEGDWTLWFNNYLFFQWYLTPPGSSTPQLVAGANGPALTLTDVLPEQNGSQVYCQMRALGYGDANGNPTWQTSQTAVLNVITSGPPHLLYSAYYTNWATASFAAFNYQPMTYVDLTFDTPMDPVALGNALNYPANCPGVTVVSATVNSNSYRSVELAVNGKPSGACSFAANNMRALGGGLPLAGANSITVGSVPLTCIDVGNPLGTDPAVPTTMYVDGTNSYTVQCEGSDIWNSYDGFNFLYEPKNANFDVVVRVKSVTHSSNWAKAGLMIREVYNDASSRDWNIVCDPAAADGIAAPDGSGYGANTIEANARIAYGQASAGWATQGSMIPDYPNAWVRITFTNSATHSIITSMYSTNGQNWSLLGQTDAATNGDAMPLKFPVYVGICTTAHNNDPVAQPPAVQSLTYLDTVEYADYNSNYVPAPPFVAPSLTLTPVSKTTLSLSWTPSNGVLYSSPALGAAEDWQPVANATNPMTITVPATAGAEMFYQVRNQ